MDEKQGVHALGGCELACVRCFYSNKCHIKWNGDEWGISIMCCGSLLSINRNLRIEMSYCYELFSRYH